MSHFGGACQVSPRKNVCLPTQLGTCSHPTGRSTVPYWCTIDVRTPWARHGVPTGPPGPHRDPTGPWRTAGGTVGPRLIGASPVWAARNSYWRSRCYLYNYFDQLRLSCLGMDILVLRGIILAIRSCGADCRVDNRCHMFATCCAST